tara:strand:+ start:349 stop:1017 length:669 start_codon:yes stop_codon:yes gene_type:complete
MKIFLDSANLDEIRDCLEKGIISGITTNPSLLSKEPKTAFVQHMKKIVELCNEYKKNIPLSVEVITTDPKEMISQAHQLIDDLNYENLNIKIPIGWDELAVISELSSNGIDVNCTCLHTEAQCQLAANAGAKYVSIFMCRIKDIGADPIPVIENTRSLLEISDSNAEIITGSIRHQRDVFEASLAGGHIVTASYQVIKSMVSHPQTNLAIEGFMNDFSDWIK